MVKHAKPTSEELVKNLAQITIDYLKAHSLVDDEHTGAYETQVIKDVVNALDSVKYGILVSIKTVGRGEFLKSFKDKKDE